MEAKPSGAETARRTVRLLRVLGEQDGPIGLDDLVTASGLSKSTAYRLLRVLQEEGWAERPAGGGYRLGAAFLGLAARTAPDAVPLDAVRPLLRELAEAAGETVTLHQRAGDLSVLLAGAEDPRSRLRRAVRPGETSPLVSDCAGYAILAWLDPAEVAPIARRASLGVAPLAASLRTVARRGHAVSNQDGLRCLAAPVDATAGDARACSVVLAGPADRWTEPRALSYADALHDTCAAVSRLIHG